MRKLYLGWLTTGGQEIFRSENLPQIATHGDKYKFVVGPFRTLTGAKAMLHYGDNNPHMQCVSDAEKIGKKYKEELSRMGKSRNYWNG